MGPCPSRCRPRPPTRWTRSPRRWRPGSRKAAPVQLHPGDLGWNWRLGAEDLAAAVRVWRRDGQILAVGLVEDAGLVRMGVAPIVDRDDAFAARLLADLSDPAQGVLSADDASVEARSGTALRRLLAESGWVADESWTPLSRDLTDPVDDCGLRVEVVGAHPRRRSGSRCSERRSRTRRSPSSAGT